ncbi:hypothetical protein KIN20_027170, partial [Parelaphostrongylus tenuis]
MVGVSSLLISLAITIAVALGCGVMPQGQAMTRNFTVNGFKIPTAMVFTTSPGAFAQLPGGIATTSDGARSIVSRVVMQTIIEVLEQQGRSAGLPDAVVSMILNQLMVQISYDPLECKTLAINPTGRFNGVEEMMRPHCIVVDSTVTALCTAMGGG